VPRIVLDCNVFVSALLSQQGSPAQILDQWADVSGDAHLTQLTDPSPPVLTPREFLEARK